MPHLPPGSHVQQQCEELWDWQLRQRDLWTHSLKSFPVCQARLDVGTIIISIYPPTHAHRCTPTSTHSLTHAYMFSPTPTQCMLLTRSLTCLHTLQPMRTPKTRSLIATSLCPLPYTRHLLIHMPRAPRGTHPKATLTTGFSGPAAT